MASRVVYATFVCGVCVDFGDESELTDIQYKLKFDELMEKIREQLEQHIQTIPRVKLNKVATMISEVDEPGSQN